jgi:hypothetical protein
MTTILVIFLKIFLAFSISSSLDRRAEMDLQLPVLFSSSKKGNPDVP